jgi:hypothetical protein
VAANEVETLHWCKELPYYPCVNKVGVGCAAAMDKHGFKGHELFMGMRYSYARHVLRHPALAFLTDRCLFCGESDTRDTPEHWLFACSFRLMASDKARRLKARQLEFMVLVRADERVAELDVVDDAGRRAIVCRMSSSDWSPKGIDEPHRRLRAVIGAVRRTPLRSSCENSHMFQNGFIFTIQRCPTPPHVPQHHPHHRRSVGCTHNGRPGLSPFAREKKIFFFKILRERPSSAMMSND